MREYESTNNPDCLLGVVLVSGLQRHKAPEMSGTMQVTCLVCHKDMNDRTGIRSNTWYRGLPGTRAVLCSPDCQEIFDEENLSYVAEVEVDE